MSETVTARLVASGFTGLPVVLAGLPGEPDHALVAEKGGLIRHLDLATGTIGARPFLDLSAEIATEGEMGLLGLALDPGFAGNGRVYVTLSNPAGDTEIRAYTAPAADRDQANPASALPILTIPQEPGSARHRGGWLGFGPDGLLYATTGDGTVPITAHDTGDLRGKVLRLDPSGDAFPADPARNYAPPEGNPFTSPGDPGADEVWAWGFRNPWRASFDPATGHLFVADVGEQAWEEVNLVAGPGPFGWPFFEGPGRFFADAEFPPAGFTFPIFAYSHASGDGASVTGGQVYRGPGEALQGRYLFGDFTSGNLWALSDADGDGTWDRSLVATPAGEGPGSLNNPTGFGVDAAGRLYALDLDGEVFHLVPNPAPLPTVEPPPQQPPPQEPSPEQPPRPTILWRHSDGSVAVWTMDGAVVADSSVPGNPGGFWTIVGSGDFGGDGHSDILWRGQDGSGFIWTMLGTQVLGTGSIGNPGSSWTVAKVSDFNGDGRSDILWRGQDGSAAVWIMDNGAVTSGGVLGNPGTSWTITGAGDFNGDGRSDILWRGQDGSLFIWNMNGEVVTGSASVSNPGSFWSVAGTADFNGDGRSDILWRGQDGSAAVWTMDNGAATGGDVVGNPTNFWSVGDTGDYNNDGRSDILWRGRDGSIVLWAMDGAQIASSQVVGAITNDWQIAAS